MKNKVVSKHVELNAENVAWFEQTYPNGSYTWLLNMLLEKFRHVTEMTPSDYALLAAKELAEEIKT